MNFGGFQKLTLLDFPGTVACTLFTKGCNFLCPFCHNAPLVNKIEEAADYSEAEILAFLKKRQGILEGVCITGGEPLLHPELANFLRKVKALGYKVKLDTNGSFPDRLQALAKEGLLDYVAMDVKNSFEKYPRTAGVSHLDLEKIGESIDFLRSGAVPCEFRTTVCGELHTAEDILAVAARISGAERYFIQNFKDSGNLVGGSFTPVSAEDLEKMRAFGAKYTKNCKIR